MRSPQSRLVCDNTIYDLAPHPKKNSEVVFSKHEDSSNIVFLNVRTLFRNPKQYMQVLPLLQVYLTALFSDSDQSNIQPRDEVPTTTYTKPELVGGWTITLLASLSAGVDEG